ncbi:MerR family transcriptional regulator [Actinoplanes sp. DH11]|uniref:MerR family transcriptional regulator n=1 Tax=Actinoplanes sp. DH11 TaxID=2857011 RepID=UPI001E3DB512|nr:MerR family transcriptional regulator [Actinoplanes sp. DH11]
MSNLIPIGRFARMARLSIKALRFYDEQGLLPPAWVDPSSGYRYYTIAQAARAETIRVLRALEMPISQIRELLDLSDPDLITKGLSDHRERLRERVAEQERMLRFLERLIERGAVMPYEVTVKTVPPQFVAALTVPTSLSRIGSDLGQGFGTLVSAIGVAGAQPAGAPFVVYHDIIDEKTDGRIEICIPVPPGLSLPPGPSVTREVPGGLVAYVVHRGPYSEISPAYHVVTGWMEQQGRSGAGAPREVYLNDPQTAAPDELLTEVQFPLAA